MQQWLNLKLFAREAVEALVLETYLSSCAVIVRTFEEPLPSFSRHTPRAPHFTLLSLSCTPADYVSCGAQP